MTHSGKPTAGEFVSEDAVFLSAACGTLPPLSFVPSAVTQCKKSSGRSLPKSRSRSTQVQAAVELLDGGATVPFIARYRKEATGGLDDIQLRELELPAGLPARTRRPARSRAQEHRRAGQADARAARRDRGRANQAGTGRPVPAVQAEAPHQGPDRPRGRHRAAGRQAVCRPVAGSGRRRPWPSSRREKGESGDDFTTVAAVLDGVRDILSERWAEDAGTGAASCANGSGPRACSSPSW